MQAIKTKYKMGNYYKPSKFKASCSEGSISIPFDYKFDYKENHKLAAHALLKKLGLNNNIVTVKLKKEKFLHVLL